MDADSNSTDDENFKEKRFLMNYLNILFQAWIVIAMVSCGGQSDQGELQDFIEEGKYKRAALWINSHAELEIPYDQIIRVAHVFSERVDFTRSVPLLEILIEKYPDNVAGRLLLANNQRELSNFNEALELYNKLVLIDSVKFIVLPERARLYTHLSEYDKAKKDITDAIKIQPKYFASFLANGLLQYAQGDTEAALELFETAEELDPGVSAEASLYAGYILLSSNINIEAMHKFTEAIDIGKNINKGYAFINRGVSQINLTDTSYACADWDSAMFYMPQDAQSYLENYCQ